MTRLNIPVRNLPFVLLLGVRLLGVPLLGVLLLGASEFGANAVYAQSAPMPEECRDTSTETLPALTTRRQRLERDIAERTASGQGGSERTSNGTASPEARAKAVAELRASQEQLLDVLFQIDCATAAARASEALERRRSARAAGEPERVIEVITYYATNRRQSSSTDPREVYGRDLDAALHYGRATVTIPSSHVPGELELPTLWKLERDADPNKHFVLKSVVPLPADGARAEIAERLTRMSSKSLLMFVHGYNVSFTDAALRTAQLAHDLKFPGMPFFYSWPSAAKALAYWQDEEAAQLSELVFDKLLDDLSQLPIGDIYIVAHSMGNRVVTGALRGRVDRMEKTKRIRALLLAAPDINAELFRTTIAPKLAAMQGTQTTIYASSSDLALRASKIVHGFQRVGETVGGVFIYPGFETIDASGAATMTRAYGHSYLMDSSSVLKDIQALMERHVAAKQRGLSEVGTSPNAFYRLQ